MTRTLHALIDSDPGPYGWKLTDTAELHIFNHPGGFAIGTLNEAGVPTWAKADVSKLRKTPFTTIREAGDYFHALFKPS